MTRSRVVSGVTFGLAAAVVGTVVLGVVAVADAVTGVPWWGPAVYALGYAVPGAAAGALVGPRLARAPTAGGAVVAGAGAVVGAAVLSVVLVMAAIVVWEAVTGENAGGIGGPGEVGLLLGYSALAGLVLSPVGMLAGWLVWRRLGHGLA